MSKKDRESQQIEGMAEETAKEYVEMRRAVDRKLHRMSALGTAVRCLSGYMPINTTALNMVGGMIEEMGDEVHEALEEFANEMDVSAWV